MSGFFIIFVKIIIYIGYERPEADYLLLGVDDDAAAAKAFAEGFDRRSHRPSIRLSA